ncbi:MAG: hypothetical protein IPP32_12705 [Bacteroidetes bacterium]|nr:hypothetical protein [Bacteroidota bacterium]
MAKQRITEGSIIEINIENQYYVYAQILVKGLGYAFFDYKSKEKLTDFSILRQSKVLFIVMVYNDVITQGKWLKVGKLEIREDLKNQPMKYIQDAINPNNFELYNPNTGEVIKATREQCEGLECAAVWESNHIEDRIRDYYLGVPNIWLKLLEITPHTLH